MDAKDVRKYLNDVLRLPRLLVSTTRVALGQKIAEDPARFLPAVVADTSIEPKTLQLGAVTVAELVGRIGHAYGIDLRARPEK